MGIKILFLGAGASAPFGLPTTKEFFNRFLSPMSELFSATVKLPDLLRRPLPVLKAEGRNQTEGKLIIINILRALRKIRGEDAFDAEEVHGWLSEWQKMLSQARLETVTLHSLVVRQMGERNYSYDQFQRDWDSLLPTGSKDSDIKDAVESALKELVRDLNVAYIVTDDQSKQAFEAWKPVFSGFRDGKHQLWIFTTNYDLLIDRMADIREFNNNFELITGFDQQGKFQGRFSLGAQSEKAIIRLCKLHGSLHWIRKRTGKIVVRTTLEEVPPPEHIGERAVVALKAVKDEDVDKEPFKTLYSKFKEVGRKADRICIIGFSLRDEPIRQALLDMIKENKSLKITVFNRSESEVIEEFIKDGNKRRKGAVRFRKGEFGKGDYQNAIVEALFR